MIHPAKLSNILEYIFNTVCHVHVNIEGKWMYVRVLLNDLGTFLGFNIKNIFSNCNSTYLRRPYAIAKAQSCSISSFLYAIYITTSIVKVMLYCSIGYVDVNDALCRCFFMFYSMVVNVDLVTS